MKETDAAWYYAKEGWTRREGPIALDELRGKSAAGELGPRDLVWREGWTEWKALAAAGEVFVAAPAADPAPWPDGLFVWMKIVGLLNILGGLALFASCVGLLPGALMLAAGIRLLGAESNLSQHASPPPDLLSFFRSLKVFLQLTGWALLMIFLGLLVLFFLHIGLFLGLVRGYLGH